MLQFTEEEKKPSEMAIKWKAIAKICIIFYIEMWNASKKYHHTVECTHDYHLHNDLTFLHALETRHTVFTTVSAFCSHRDDFFFLYKCLSLRQMSLFGFKNLVTISFLLKNHLHILYFDDFSVRFVRQSKYIDIIEYDVSCGVDRENSLDFSISLSLLPSKTHDICNVNIHSYTRKIRIFYIIDYFHSTLTFIRVAHAECSYPYQMHSGCIFWCLTFV